MIIEHNVDVIKTADWIIDLGPKGSNRDRDGEIVTTGTPEEIALHKKSHTGCFLAPLLKNVKKQLMVLAGTIN